MTTSRLTETQRLVLEHAAEHADGQLVWFPGTVKGEARRKVIESLAKRNFAVRAGENWIATLAGLDAVGLALPAPEVALDGLADSAVMATADFLVQRGPAPTSRAHSKQAEVVQMLQRPEGATILQIMAATGWLAHTVRGCLAGAIKKKLGLAIVSEKPDGGDRIYRLN